MPLLRRLLSLLLACVLSVAPAFGTWSIVAVNTRTGEVLVGIATCIEDFNLRTCCPILIPEVGVACAQKFTAPDQYRQFIWDMMHLGMDPETILEELAVMDAGHDQRQYGFADLAGRSATWTGSFPGDWQGGVAGADGEIVYAIQGNVLAGAAVVSEAEAAFLNTQGDMAERLMAAMEAAMAMGGDGRCSCSVADPDSCGTPPPGFEKSAHNGGMFLARPGDTEGPAGGAQGYANGDYYLWINIAGRGAGAEDPVILMRQQYDQWRLDLQGRPDAILSERSQSRDAVPAGEPAVVTIELRLVDLEGVPLSTGGAAISLQHEARSAGMSTLQAVTDHGDGTYTVEILSGDAPGVDRFRLIVDDGIRPVHLWPPFELRHEPSEEAPWNGLEEIAGLDAAGPFLGPARLLQGGLVAWYLAGPDSGQMRLWRAERAAPGDPFGAPEEVVLFGSEPVGLTGFWVSEDELRLVLSGVRHEGPEQGVEKLFRTDRGAADQAFPAPERIEELDSGTGDGAPWLSPDELELWFHSRRGGRWALWRATRLAPDAFWYPPEAVELGGDAAEHREPLLGEGGTRLYLARREAGDGGPRLAVAEADGPGNRAFGPPRPLPGAPGPRLAQAPSWRSADGRELWIHAWNEEAGVGRLYRKERADQSLEVLGSPVSAASGGRLDFLLDAGPERAGASFLVLGSGSPAPGGLEIAGMALPLERDAFTDLLLQEPGALAVVDLDGRLDAQGRGAAALELAPGTPLPAVWLDRPYRFCFVATDGMAPFVSNVVTAELVP